MPIYPCLSEACFSGRSLDDFVTPEQVLADGGCVEVFDDSPAEAAEARAEKIYREDPFDTDRDFEVLVIDQGQLRRYNVHFQWCLYTKACEASS